MDQGWVDLPSIPAALTKWSRVEWIRARWICRPSLLPELCGAGWKGSGLNGSAAHPCCPDCVEQSGMDQSWVDLPSIPAALTLWSRVGWIRAGWI